MANLSNFEKRSLEKLFQMGSGYVLDFSNRTFAEFVMDSTGKDILDEKYNYASGSKANRLRAFWSQEPNHIVGKLLSDLFALKRESGLPLKQQQLFENCSRTVGRLREGALVCDIDAFIPITNERDFAVLADSVKDYIEKNQPEAGLDRLHTFLMKYMRALCAQRNLPLDKEEPLHNLAGKYVRKLKDSGEIESEMTERILKSNISLMDAFNRVRNNQTFAHDNPILNYDESLLIFNHVAGAIKFIQALEQRKRASNVTSRPADPLTANDIGF